MISIRNLTKRFDGNPVWEDINLDIRDGETIVIDPPEGLLETCRTKI